MSAFIIQVWRHPTWKTKFFPSCCYSHPESSFTCTFLDLNLEIRMEVDGWKSLDKPDPKWNFTFPVVYFILNRSRLCTCYSTSNITVAEHSAAVLKLFICVVWASFWEIGRTREQKNPPLLDLNKGNYHLFGLDILHCANIDIKTPKTNMILYANHTLIKQF